MIRCIDIVVSLVGLLFGLPVFVAIYLASLFDTGSPLFFQQRVGRNKRAFTLVKFRTMKPETKSVATHLASADAVTPFGKFLRSSKLDELPQLWNVLKGEMSLVGPRPCLFNQEQLIQERELRGVLKVRPGITGLAQVNDIDMSDPKRLAEWDARMLQNFTLKHYIKYVLLTASGRGTGDRIVS